MQSWPYLSTFCMLQRDHIDMIMVYWESVMVMILTSGGFRTKTPMLSHGDISPSPMFHPLQRYHINVTAQCNGNTYQWRFQVTAQCNGNTYQWRFQVTAQCNGNTYQWRFQVTAQCNGNTYQWRFQVTPQHDGNTYRWRFQDSDTCTLSRRCPHRRRHCDRGYGHRGCGRRSQRCWHSQWHHPSGQCLSSPPSAVAAKQTNTWTLAHAANFKHVMVSILWNLVNPFTVPACKMSRLKAAQTLQKSFRWHYKPRCLICIYTCKRSHMHV